MDINHLKSEWKQFDQKLATSQRLNDQLIQSMLRERSRSRVATIRRDTFVYMILMCINVVLLAGIFAGNPFDFQHKAQYIPYGLLAIGVLLAIASLVKTLRRFNVDMNKVNLTTFLQTTIEGYEKNKRMEGWFGMIIFSAGVLTIFSFLPKKLENKGLWPALAESAITIFVTLAIYFIAFKLGAFKNRKREGFENDLQELNDLKAIAQELRNN